MLAMEDIVSMTREFFAVDVNPEMSKKNVMILKE